jgi:hypothetical protein
VRSRPIIEDTTRARFAPYAFAFPGGAALLSAAGLSDADHGDAADASAPCSDAWRQVDDFAWLRATPSPNWSVLPPEERAAPPPAPALGGNEGAAEAAAQEARAPASAADSAADEEM